MRNIALLSAAALVAGGLVTNSAAQARDGGAIAAGVIGGLAAGALLGAAVSESRAAPAYGYGYDYVPPPRPIYRPAPVVRVEEYEAPVYETRRVVSYERVPVGYGYRPAPVRWHRDWDRPYGYGGW